MRETAEPCQRSAARSHRRRETGEAGDPRRRSNPAADRYHTPVDPSAQELIHRMAAKYVWWKPPEDAARVPHRVVAQVMHLGDYDDVQALITALGDEYLREVLRNAEAGVFDERSWTYWHYRLGLAEPGAVPRRPARRFA